MAALDLKELTEMGIQDAQDNIMFMQKMQAKKEYKALIRSNSPCTYCGGNKREKSNSCYGCGSVDFEDNK